ncbi:MAG: LysM peptidoglycan-binding domain-containing protein [Nitrospirota bacterium]|nr:LysM peptidoglycan-binding domain-containing protein [Nitrospirota bacterium]MDH5295644.1 LysM peptidoglycan-binding domain-containing protein [Nitrospirota bacterium]
MRYLEKTLQVQSYCLPLRAVFFARQVLVVSSVVLATWAFLPQSTLGQISTIPSPHSSEEPLTFNYSLANSPQGPEHSTVSQEISPQRERIESSYNAPNSTLETQLDGSIHDNPYFEQSGNQAEQSKVAIPVITDSPIEDLSIASTPSVLSDEPSALALDESNSLHQPASFNDEVPSRKDSNPSHSEAIANTHEIQSHAADAREPVAPSLIDPPQESQTRSATTFPPKLRFNAKDSVEQRSQVFQARFARVFDPTWEAPPQKKPGAYGSIPLVLNESVEKNLEYFQFGIPERFQSYLDRFHHYQDLVEPVFRELGLPQELMYLSLVESGFNPRAFSRSRASGPWQFMKGTGRVYGLDVDWYLDERRDPIKSTVAAAHHLRDLYDQFGSWPLALAAYNAGSGKISRAIKKTGTRDFWTIRRSRHIRRETKEYVPRFIAATLIAQNPTAYGFSTPDGERHEFEEVLITKRVHLSAVTQQTGIPVEELQRLNPELRRSIVPSLTGPGYYLKVPLGMASLVEEHQPRLAVWTQPPPPPTEWYQVRRGDSLSVVAKRFGMKVSQLKAMNGLRNNILRVGTKLRVRGAGDEDYTDTEIRWYRVRSGDSLGNIATRFGISVNSLMRLNNLSSHIIHPGDRLRVKEKPEASPSSRNDSKWYQVRRGDSLWTIAKQFSVSVQELRALNNLSSSIIQAGRMLMVSQ